MIDARERGSWNLAHRFLSNATQYLLVSESMQEGLEKLLNKHVNVKSKKQRLDLHLRAHLPSLLHVGNARTIAHCCRKLQSWSGTSPNRHFVCCRLLLKLIGSQIILSWGQDAQHGAWGVDILQGFSLALARSLFSTPTLFLLERAY